MVSSVQRARLLQGGESGVFTPMHLLVFRKAGDEKPASYAEAVKSDA